MGTTSDGRNGRVNGERVVVRLNRHWLVPAAELLVTAPLMLAALVAALAAVDLIDQADWPLLLLSGLAVAGGWLGIPMLRWASATLTMTTGRVVVESGVLRHVCTSIPRDRIQSIEVRESLLGRIAGYATIDIGTAAGRPVTFSHVPTRALPDELLAAAPETPERGAGRASR